MSEKSSRNVGVVTRPRMRSRGNSGLCRMSSATALMVPSNWSENTRRTYHFRSEVGTERRCRNETTDALQRQFRVVQDVFCNSADGAFKLVREHPAHVPLQIGHSDRSQASRSRVGVGDRLDNRGAIRVKLAVTSGNSLNEHVRKIGDRGAISVSGLHGSASASSRRSLAPTCFVASACKPLWSW